MGLGYAEFLDNFLPYFERADHALLMAKALIPVVPLYILYSGVKKAFRAFERSCYQVIDDAIFHIDQILSKYANVRKRMF